MELRQPKIIATSASRSFILVFLNFYIYSPILLLLLGRLTTASAPPCPKACFCNAPSKIVYCSRRGLGRIPTGVPSDSLQLNLNGNVFQSPNLQRSNFSGLDALEHLYLSECGIERLEMGVFSELTNLKWLDLSNNRIRSVDEYSFRGLVLQHLFLNGNRHIQLVPDSFTGLTTTGLYLHDCSLSRLSPDVLQPLNASLKYLWLNGNELDRFDQGFRDIFHSLSHLRLGSNPLHCNCEIVWLKEFYDKNGEVFKGAVLPSCLTPQRLKGQYFSELSLFDFRCQAPTFSNIETMFGASNGKLKCTASGDPAPTLYWIQPSGKTTRYSPPSDEEVRTNEGILTIQSKDATTSGDEDGTGLVGMYICVANNEAGNVTLTINVSWPLLPPELPPASLSTVQTSHEVSSPQIKFIIPSTSSGRPGLEPLAPSPGSGGHNSAHTSTDIPGEGADRRTYTVLNVPQQGDQAGGEAPLRRQRLFTVSEFVCAVVGAHVGTLLLCIVVIPLIYRARWRRRVLEKQRQQQLHHQLHYDMQIETQQGQQQQLLHQIPPSVAGTPSRSKLLHNQHTTSDTERSDSIYLNGNGIQHRPPSIRPPLYLTDYLLPPQK